MRNILAVMAVIGCFCGGCAGFTETCKGVLDSTKNCMTTCATQCATGALIEGLGKCKLKDVK